MQPNEVQTQESLLTASRLRNLFRVMYTRLRIRIECTNTVPELAWKANNIIFDGTTMKEAVEILEQHFKVDIEIANEELNACEVNAWFTKGNETLDDILTPVCVVLEARVVRQGNKIVIEGGKGCGNK